jgi:protein TonB
MHRSLSYFSAALLLIPSASSAQTTDTKDALNVHNWEVFHKLYPARALVAKEEGAVGFKVTIDKGGNVTECKVTHSSGHPLLDQETCNLITLHAEFKPMPDLSPSQSRTSEGMIAWKLPASTTTLAPPKTAAVPELDAVVCKKSVRTGTLGGVDRTCMTKREWAKQADDLRQPWSELQGRKGTTAGVSCIRPSGC